MLSWVGGEVVLGSGLQVQCGSDPVWQNVVHVLTAHQHRSEPDGSTALTVMHTTSLSVIVQQM